MSNNLYIKALDFAKDIVILYKDLAKNKVEEVLLKQMLQSGTSIGANIAEAQGSVSEADYISKIHIAYKELLETQYWLELLNELKFVEEERFNMMSDKKDELAKILYTIIKNINAKKR